MGNSEVGHLNLGAGRPVAQDLPRIDAAIEDGSFWRNEALLTAATRAGTDGRRLHLVTLVGPGGVHAVDRHAVAVAALAFRAGVRNVAVHGLLDGRDTPPRSAAGFVADLERRLGEAHPGARIATLAGRYYGMDRDTRWERVERAYRAIVEGEGLRAPDAASAVAEAYARDEDDEFVQPTVVGPPGAEGTVRDGDVLVHCNFRADRARQLIHALVDSTFGGFPRLRPLADLFVVTMTRYEADLPVAVAFPPAVVTSLAEHFSKIGWRQFHIAETEKYAHVTYFFNGGIEAPWPGEERLLVPSPHVATYDLAPEMSATGVTEGLVSAIRSGDFDFIVANYANPDMVAHTGAWGPTIRALEHIDRCIGEVVDAFALVDGQAVAAGGSGAVLCITADHGNADLMLDEQGRPVTAHSLNPVPIVLVGELARVRTLSDGVLADVAPTLLELLGEAPLAGMTGRSLLSWRPTSTGMEPP
jgi:2,3-bisphosphoglycerate-independent phosphoglycerate mutase